MSHPSALSNNCNSHLFMILKRSTFYAVNLGVLGPKQKKEVTVSFRTDEAKVIIATLVVKVHEGASELTKVVKLSAIGKYPFMTLDQ